MPSLSRRAVACALSMSLAMTAACAPGAPSAGAPGAGPAPAGERRGPPNDTATAVVVPPMPLDTGPLTISVVSPRPNIAAAPGDSTTVFGSVGNGRARLTINGTPVKVYPDGGFLAWLPNPGPAAGANAGTGAFNLVAVLGGDSIRRSSPDTARFTLPLRIAPPRAALSDSGPLVVDSASLQPRAPLSLGDPEPVRVAIRAPATADVWIDYGIGQRRSLVRSDRRDAWVTDLSAGDLRTGAMLVAARGSDTVRLRLPLPRVPGAGDGGARYASLVGDSTVLSDTERVVIVRPTPGGTGKWFLLPGTVVRVTGGVEGWSRIRLDQRLDAWVDTAAVRPLPDGTPAPVRIAGDAVVVSDSGWSDVVIPIGTRSPPPFLVEETGSDVAFTLYGTVGNTDIIGYQASPTGTDHLVTDVTWEQATSDRVRYLVHLAAPPYGYLVLWRRGAIVLRLRRPPTVSADAPLRGLTIAVDPGHPPGGATGPTGLYEGDVALAVARRLQPMLEAQGARVVMTRVTADALALADRPVLARRAGADVLVSIHLNALPDHVNPFAANGTGTYYFHPQAAALARAVQHALVRRLGLRDRGVHYDYLALARPTWMPSILCEGAFLFPPEQEAALRTAAFQDAYARGIAEGLRDYFRALALEGRTP
jgi:N-acetylmuramoyl-L-alanine amidase